MQDRTRQVCFSDIQVKIRNLRQIIHKKNHTGTQLLNKKKKIVNNIFKNNLNLNKIINLSLNCLSKKITRSFPYMFGLFFSKI